MHDVMVKTEINNVKLIYCFKIFRVLFTNSDKAINRKLVEKIMNFYHKFVNTQKVTDAELLSAIFDDQEQHNLLAMRMRE
jgi:hypothetical protein